MDMTTLASKIQQCYSVSDLVKVETSLTMSSREIAELTGKEHFHVKRDIQQMFSELEIDASKFGCIYFDSLSREQVEFKLDEELTLTLVSGYSTVLRNLIVKQWLEMRALISQQQQEIIKLREAELKRLGTDLARVENKAKSAKVLAAMVNKTLVKQYRTSPELQEAAIAVLEAEVDYIHSERNFRFLYDNTAAELHMTQDKLRELDRYTKTCCKVKPDFAHWPYPNLLEVLGYRRPRVANL